MFKTLLYILIVEFLREFMLRCAMIGKAQEMLRFKTSEEYHAVPINLASFDKMVFPTSKAIEAQFD